MKSHPAKEWPAFSGMNDTDDPDRIPDDELALLLNGTCDPTGKITKYFGSYPVTMADDLGVTETKTKIHCAAANPGKNEQTRAVAVVGASLLRSGPNNIFQTWVPITFPTETSTPALDRVAAFAFRNRFAYHQNGLDMPFRVKMEEDDGSTPADEAEMLGLRPPPLSAITINANGVGTLFPDDSITAYAVTYVYGDRGESAPGPIHRVQYAASSVAQFDINGIPKGPTGVTKRRIYRSRIATGVRGAGTAYVADPSLWEGPSAEEMFLLTELADNTTTTYSDILEDAALNYNVRMPPQRMLVPVAKYQIMHQDRIILGNLREHPWVFQVAAYPANTVVTAATITISNTGNGTITIDLTGASDITISNYKTKSLATIRAEINQTYNAYNGVVGGNGPTTSNVVSRVAPLVDDTRTYRFKEITGRNILGSENAYWLEAIDDSSDAVVVDGTERFPNRFMFLDRTFPEQVNPFSQADIAQNSPLPIRGLFRDDYTLGVMTRDHIWLVTGSLSLNPQSFKPDFSVARSQSEHGNYCTRPDSIFQTPSGLLFVARDGLRLFRGQTSKPFARQIRKRLMRRLLVEPRTRDNLCMIYDDGKLFIAFAGMEVA